MNILKIRAWFKLAIGISLVFGFCGADGQCQVVSHEFEAKIDSLIVAAYQAATEDFPCKMKAKGNPRMIRWQDVDACLNEADDRVDWEGLSLQIETLRQDENLLRADVSDVVESALAAHAIPYNRVISVDKNDALLPLSNSVLKFLPDGSLMGAPVFDKRTKEQVGTFAGVFIYEKSGGLSAANTYKLSIFQYTNLRGEIQVPAGDRLLLDSYGVPWKDAVDQPGFRLTPNRIGLKY